MTQPRDPRRPPSTPEEEPALDLGLEPDAPLELPMDALILEEDPDALFITDEAQAIEPYTPPEEAVPLMEGFESTTLEDRSARPPPEARGMLKKPLRADFVFTTCPACEAQQPDPAPAFCESCGQRLRNPRKKGSASDQAMTKRCGECGYKNYEEAVSCTNCGMRL